MRKPKPLNLSSCEEISRDEMRSMVAGSINETYYYTSGSGVDSGTVLWEAAKAACYGKSAGDDCEFGYGGGLPYYGKCGYASSGSQRVLVCGSNYGSGSGNSGTLGPDDAKEFACQGKKELDDCGWIDANLKEHRGVCLYKLGAPGLYCSNLNP